MGSSISRPVKEAQELINLLKEKSLFKIPIPIEALAEVTGCHIMEYNFTSLNGMLYVLNGHKYLIYNPNIITSRIRFTIAHEFGHYILGHPTTINTDPLNNGKSRYDREADRFAEEILMPAKRFELSYIYYLKGVGDSYKPRSLARIYGVSRQAARLRIERLGLN